MNSSSVKAIKNFTIIWLTTTHDDTHLLMQLQRIINSSKIFNEIEECINYLNKIEGCKVFMIIDYTLGSELILQFDKLSQIYAIYLLKNEEEQHNIPILVSTKVKGTFTDIESIINSIKANIQRWNDTELSISSISSSDILSNDLNRLDSSFMYSQLIKEVLLEIKYSDTAKTELAEYCCQLQSCGGTKNVSSEIDTFAQDYDKHTPIWCYTRYGFTYSMMNQALRDQDAKTLIKMGFFLRDVHRRIEVLHKKNSSHKFSVYRGQGMCKNEFEKMILNNQGGLLSFNNFLSTSCNYSVARFFAETAPQNETLVCIIFKMDIDATMSSTPFAELVGEDSNFGSEGETLFSMHTIFRIIEVAEIEDRLWYVTLELTSDQDKELICLSKQIRTEIEGGTALYRLSHLLAKMGKFSEATDVLLKLLNTTPKNQKEYHAAISHQLGFIYREEGKYKLALTYYHKALGYLHNTFLIDHHSLGITYNDIGEINRDQGNNLPALVYYQKTLEHFEQSFGPIRPWQFAILYSNIGQVFRSMGDYSTALGFFQKVLAIYKDILPQNDPLFAVIYNNIGAVYDTKGEYLKALSFYEKTLNIEQRSLPADHPTLAATYHNLGNVYLELKEYDNALSQLEKSIKIMENSGRHNHLSIAVTYSNMGKIYLLRNNDHWMALQYFEKARRILEENGATNNPTLATVYHLIGEAYLAKSDYQNALDFFKIALRNQKKNLLPGHLHMCHTYAGLARAFHELQHYENAQKSLKLAIEIARLNETPAGTEVLDQLQQLSKTMYGIIL